MPPLDSPVPGPSGLVDGAFGWFVLAWAFVIFARAAGGLATLLMTTIMGLGKFFVLLLVIIALVQLALGTG